jgi:SAM-dependent methyltransferase
MHPLPQPAAIRGLARFIRDWQAYNRLASPGCPFAVRPSEWMPVLTEWEDQAGIPDPYYFYQDLWAARLIYRRSPARHVDVGSRIDGFIAHLLTFMRVTVVDIRQLRSTVPGLDFIRSDATDLREFLDDSIESLSSLHAVEHFGLGRYGDPVDPQAPFKVMAAFVRVLAPGGFLYFSVPVGRERLVFNAHRIFAPSTITSALDGLKLLSFSAVSDRGELLENIDPGAALTFEYGCGLFEFTK